ncbi:MAG: hypothetical protein Q9221_002093 [Calogaya cf. arnoldii]
MHLFVPLILAFGVVTIQAESKLVCLGWGLTSPALGLWCHFSPKSFNKAEAEAVGAVDDAVKSVAKSTKDLVKFDLTHNPVTVTYNFLHATSEGGLSQGLESIAKSNQDFKDLTIGFEKESANQAVAIFNLAKFVQVVSRPIWQDVAFCLIAVAGRSATKAGLPLRKRAALPSATDAVKISQACIDGQFKSVAKPFNITEPTEKVGATISDLAALLIPVGGEEAVGAKAAEEAVELAIPGSEATTRVMKFPTGKESNVAEYFTNDEALATRESMKDENWAKANCRLCTPPTPKGATVARSLRGHSRSRLVPRGNILTSCCRVPTTLPEIGQSPDTIPDVGQDYEESWDPESYQSERGHDPDDYNYIKEDLLKPPTDYVVRDLNGAQAIKEDLDTLSTSLIPWSPDLLTAMDSTQLMRTLRTVFEGPETDPLYRALKIYERDGKLRMQTRSNDWIRSTDPVLAPLKDFANKAIEQGKATVGKLKGLTPEQTKAYTGELEIFYTAPSDKARTGVDPRGFHYDHGTMQFACSDTPGLVVLNYGAKTAERVKVVPDTFHLMKALAWDVDAFLTGGLNGPTWHSVFGPEMAERGRVSVVMDIMVPSTGEPFAGAFAGSGT